MRMFCGDVRKDAGTTTAIQQSADIPLVAIMKASVKPEIMQHHGYIRGQPLYRRKADTRMIQPILIKRMTLKGHS